MDVSLALSVSPSRSAFYDVFQPRLDDHLFPSPCPSAAVDIVVAMNKEKYRFLRCHIHIALRGQWWRDERGTIVVTLASP